MSTVSKDFLIKVGYTSADIQQFFTDMNKAKEIAKQSSIEISKAAEVMSVNVKNSTDKVKGSFREVTTVFADAGKQIQIVSREYQRAGEVGSASVNVFGQTALKSVANVKALAMSIEELKQKGNNLGELNKQFALINGQKADKIIKQPELKNAKLSEEDFSGTKVPVSIQNLDTVVQNADKSFSRFRQTIKTFHDGSQEIIPSIQNVTSQIQKQEQAAERLAKAQQLLVEKQAGLAQRRLGASTASDIDKDYAAKQAEAITYDNKRNATLKEQARVRENLAFVTKNATKYDYEWEQETRKLATNLNTSAKVIETNTKLTEKNGQAVYITTSRYRDGQAIITKSFQSTAQGVKETTQPLELFSQQAKKADINLGQLINRALVTIPTWLVLRSSIMGVFTGIRDGVTNLVSFDLALQQVKRNLTGTPEEINKNFSTLKQNVTDFSLRTGIAVEDISSAIKEFATIGFSFKDAMAGGIESTKLATLLFGNAKDTAAAFATSLKLLTKEGEGYPPVAQQIAETMALTAQLAIDNKDDIGELTQGLNRFSATAATANLSMKETVTLLLTLATAGRSGANSGTLLSTTMNNLLLNLDKVSKQFGINFNPAVDNAFTTLMKVLDAAEKLSKTKGGEIQVVEKLKDVLGGERGTKIVSSLLAVNDILQKNIKVTGDVTKFNKDFNDQLETENKLMSRIQNNLRETGKAFVIGVTGANGFQEALKIINTTVEDMIPKLTKVSIVAGNAFRIIGNFANPNRVGFGDIGKGLSLRNIDAENVEKKLREFHLKLSQGLRGELSKVDLEKLKVEIKDIQLVGTGSLVPLARIKYALDKAVSKDNVGLTGPGKPKTETIAEATRSLENELEELKARLKAKGASDIQLKLLDVDFLKSKPLAEVEVDKIRDEQSKIRIATMEKQRSIQDILLSSVESQAKAEGASNLEAISRRIELENQLGIQRTGMDLLNQQLQLQVALTEETKKTKNERINELAALVKKTPKQSMFGLESGFTSTRESNLVEQAKQRGISEDKINSILHPEAQVAKGNSLLKDLQAGLANPMTKSMGSLEFAINSLTDTILKQETRPTGESVPNAHIPSSVADKITKPNSKENKAVKQVMDEF